MGGRTGGSADRRIGTEREHRLVETQGNREPDLPTEAP